MEESCSMSERRTGQNWRLRGAESDQGLRGCGRLLTLLPYRTTTASNPRTTSAYTARFAAHPPPFPLNITLARVIQPCAPLDAGNGKALAPDPEPIEPFSSIADVGPRRGLCESVREGEDEDEEAYEVVSRL